MNHDHQLIGMVFQHGGLPWQVRAVGCREVVAVPEALGRAEPKHAWEFISMPKTWVWQQPLRRKV